MLNRIKKSLGLEDPYAAFIVGVALSSLFTSWTWYLFWCPRMK